MFKQAEKTTNENNQANNTIEKLGTISQGQQAEFANITGRFDTAFKIGKPAETIIGKSAN